MDTVQLRVLKLEAQMNAMAQAWIYLASLVEMEGGLDMTRMETCLRRRRWATAPDINPEAREMLRWMCDRLDEGRAVRREARPSVENASQAPHLGRCS